MLPVKLDFYNKSISEFKTDGLNIFLPVEKIWDILTFATKQTMVNFGLTCKSNYIITLVYLRTKQKNKLILLIEKLNQFISNLINELHFQITADNYELDHFVHGELNKQKSELLELPETSPNYSELLFGYDLSLEHTEQSLTNFTQIYPNYSLSSRNVNEINKSRKINEKRLDQVLKKQNELNPSINLLIEDIISNNSLTQILNYLKKYSLNYFSSLAFACFSQRELFIEFEKSLTREELPMLKFFLRGIQKKPYQPRLICPVMGTQTTNDLIVPYTEEQIFQSLKSNSSNNNCNQEEVILDALSLIHSLCMHGNFEKAKQIILELWIRLPHKNLECLNKLIYEFILPYLLTNRVGLVCDLLVIIINANTIPYKDFTVPLRFLEFCYSRNIYEDIKEFLKKINVKFAPTETKILEKTLFYSTKQEAGATKKKLSFYQPSKSKIAQREDKFLIFPFTDRSLYIQNTSLVQISKILQLISVQKFKEARVEIKLLVLPSNWPNFHQRSLLFALVYRLTRSQEDLINILENVIDRKISKLQSGLFTLIDIIDEFGLRLPQLPITLNINLKHRFDLVTLNDLKLLPLTFLTIYLNSIELTNFTNNKPVMSDPHNRILDSIHLLIESIFKNYPISIISEFLKTINNPIVFRVIMIYLARNDKVIFNTESRPLLYKWIKERYEDSPYEIEAHIKVHLSNRYKIELSNENPLVRYMVITLSIQKKDFAFTFSILKKLNKNNNIFYNILKHFLDEAKKSQIVELKDSLPIIEQALDSSSFTDVLKFRALPSRNEKENFLIQLITNSSIDCVDDNNLFSNIYIKSVFDNILKDLFMIDYKDDIDSLLKFIDNLERNDSGKLLSFLPEILMKHFIDIVRINSFDKKFQSYFTILFNKCMQTESKSNYMECESFFNIASSKMSLEDCISYYESNDYKELKADKNEIEAIFFKEVCHFHSENPQLEIFCKSSSNDTLYLYLLLSRNKFEQAVNFIYNFQKPLANTTLNTIQKLLLNNRLYYLFLIFTNRFLRNDQTQIIINKITKFLKNESIADAVYLSNFCLNNKSFSKANCLISLTLLEIALRKKKEGDFSNFSTNLNYAKKIASRIPSLTIKSISFYKITSKLIEYISNNEHSLIEEDMKSIQQCLLSIKHPFLKSKAIENYIHLLLKFNITKDLASFIVSIPLINFQLKILKLVENQSIRLDLEDLPENLRKLHSIASPSNEIAMKKYTEKLNELLSNNDLDMASELISKQTGFLKDLGLIKLSKKLIKQSALSKAKSYVLQISDTDHKDQLIYKLIKRNLIQLTPNSTNNFQEIKKDIDELSSKINDDLIKRRVKLELSKSPYFNEILERHELNPLDNLLNATSMSKKASKKRKREDS